MEKLEKLAKLDDREGIIRILREIVRTYKPERGEGREKREGSK